MTSADSCTYTLDIDASPDRVWRELTSVGTPRPWMFDSVTESTWQVGSPYSQGNDGFTLIDGAVQAVEEKHRLTLTFDCHWDEDVEAEPAALLDYTLSDSPKGGTHLVVSLTGLAPHTGLACHRDTPVIYDGLKSHLETVPV